jgi:hypothetical protein
MATSTGPSPNPYQMPATKYKSSLHHRQIQDDWQEVSRDYREDVQDIRKRSYEVDIAREPEPSPSSFAADDESDGLTCWSGARRRAKGSSSIAHVEMSKVYKSLVLARVMSGEGLRGLSDDGVGTDVWCNTNNEFVSDLITSVWIQVRKSRVDFRLPDRLRIEQTPYPWEARAVSGGPCQLI